MGCLLKPAQFLPYSLPWELIIGHSDYFLPVQVLQLALWLAPNAWSITRSYAWFGRFVAICGILRWSLINVVSQRLHTAGWASGEVSAEEALSTCVRAPHHPPALCHFHH